VSGPPSGRTSGGGRAALGCRVAETVRTRRPTGRRSRRRVLGLLAVLVPGLVACADLRRPEVEEVAVAFGAPGADPASRCALLAPATVATLEHEESTGCAQALGELELPGGTVESIAVWGDNAQVRLSGDTLFLNRTDQGWKITAAGCQPSEEAPYRCRVEA
jgi:hypothetical protein